VLLSADAVAGQRPQHAGGAWAAWRARRGLGALPCQLGEGPLGAGPGDASRAAADEVVMPGRDDALAAREVQPAETSEAAERRR